MKDRSLFHLLMARLRQLTSGLPAHERDFAESLQGSLKIEQSGDWFSVTWRWRNKQYDLNAPGDAFHFYVRGDVGKAPAIRGGRAENWKSAEALLRRIAELSGERLPADPRPGSLNIFVFDQTDSGPSHILLIMPGVMAGLVALALAGVEIAVWTAIAAITLAYLNDVFRYTMPRGWTDGLAPVVIALGALVPSCFMMSPMSAAVLALSIALFSRAELLGVNASIIDWTMPGAATGSLVLVMGQTGWVALVIVAVFILLVLALMPRRLPPIPAVTAVAVAFVVAIMITVFGVRLSPAIAVGPVAYWLHWLIAGIFAVTFLLGWVFGHLFLLFPWLGLGMIAATCLAALIGLGGDAAQFPTALAGFGLCALARLLYACVPQLQLARQ